jgi:hypothetical protein
MTQVILSLLLGGLLVGLMLYWFLRRDAAANDISAAWDALSSLQTSFLPAAVVTSIFDRSDFLFVREQRNRHILRLLETERKAIALDWLRYTRSEVKLLMAYHVKSARHSVRLPAALEIKLALGYAGFLLAFATLVIFVRIAGPFRASSFAQRTLTLAALFCATSEKILSIADGPHARPQAEPIQ